MKKFILCPLLIASGILYAQIPVADSISMGAGYANMVYYSFGTSSKTSAFSGDWDLQIWTNLMSASIRTNDGAGVMLYELQNHDTSDWSSVDTAGMTPIYNTDTSWEISAFNAHQTGHPNYGWGFYQGSGTLEGIKIFVIKTVKGNFKKIWVKRLVSGDDYEFAVANLDGSNENTFTITKTDYSSKSFIYYSIDSARVIDIEPPKAGWDLVFRKYWAVDTSYVVTGVLSHPSVLVAEARGINIISNDYSPYPFNESTSEIGYDWKSFSMITFQWQLATSLAYFVEAQDGFIYKIVFTGFAGSSTGKVLFLQTQLPPPVTAVADISNIRALTVYPTPAVENVQAIFSLQKDSEVAINIFDLSGKSHFSTSAQSHTGLNALTLQTDDLTQGFYLLTVDDGNNKLTYKFIKN